MTAVPTRGLVCAFRLTVDHELRGSGEQRERPQDRKEASSRDDLCTPEQAGDDGGDAEHAVSPHGPGRRFGRAMLLVDDEQSADEAVFSFGDYVGLRARYKDSPPKIVVKRAGSSTGSKPARRIIFGSRPSTLSAASSSRRTSGEAKRA